MEEAATKRSASFWVLAVLTATLLVFSSAALIHFFTSGARLAGKALSQGQRAIVSFEDGKIEGNLFKAPEALQPPPPPEPPALPEVKPDAAVKPPVNPAGDGTIKPPVDLPPVAIPPEVLAEAQLPPGKQMPMPQYSRGTESLALAPYSPLTEKVGDLTIPRISPETKETPWQYYGKEVPAGKRPMVAVVITGLGVSRSTTDAFLSLPPIYTLSFTPYGKDSPLWVINARNKGFESWVDLPVEPSDYPASDPGPHAVLGDKDMENNTKNLHWTLSRLQGFVGVIVPVSEKFTLSNDVATLIVKEISTRGLQLSYLKTALNADFGKQTTANKNLVVAGDMLLDEKLTAADIQARLQSLIDKAKKDGVAVGYARPYPVTLETLKAWTQTLKDSGVDLVPLTKIADKIQ